MKIRENLSFIILYYKGQNYPDTRQDCTRPLPNRSGHFYLPFCRRQQRLTPAYAGKTLVGGVERLEQEAHPRLRGESVDLADEVHGFAEDAHAVKLCAGEVDRRIAGILCPED